MKKNRRNCFWSAICCSVSLSRQAGFAPAGEVFSTSGEVEDPENENQNNNGGSTPTPSGDFPGEGD